MDDWLAHPGRLGASSRSGSCITMGGSSVAAPLATAQLAEWPAGWPVNWPAPGAQADRSQIFHAYRWRDARQWEDTPPKPPPAVVPEFGGGGRLTVKVHRQRR